MRWKPISHRGRINAEKNGVPGNVLRAFELLLEIDPDAEVETDARKTWPGLIIVGHDNLLQVGTNGQGFANQLGRDGLAALKVKCGGQVTDYGMPELEDLMRLFDGRGVIHLELKYGPEDPDGLLDGVLEVFGRYPKQKVTLSSFNHPALLRVPPHIPIGVLTNTMVVDTVGYLRQFTAGGRPLDQVAFHPDLWNLTGEVLTAVQGAGMQIRAYTVPPDMFEWTYAHGVHPITDHYAEALEFFARKSA